MIVWRTSPPHILQIQSLDQVATQCHSFSCSSSGLWNIFHHFSRVWDQLYGPFRLGLSNEVRWRPNFTYVLIGESPIFPAAREVLRHFLTERYENWISRYLDLSPPWCRHFQYLDVLTGAPTTNFAGMWLPTRSYGKGTGIVIPIIQTQLWEWEGNQESSYETKMDWRRQFFLRIASESEKVFAKIFDEFFRCPGLPKTSVF